MFKIVGRHLDLVLVKHIAVGDWTVCSTGPYQIEHTLDVLQIHRDALKPVGDFTGHRFALQTTDLLEVSELCDLHTVQPDFPAQSPGTQRG